MKVASVADVKAKLSAYLTASREGPVVVTRNGKAVAVLLAVEDDEELERLVMGHSPRLRAILDAARSRVRAGKGVPHATRPVGLPAVGAGEFPVVVGLAHRGQERRLVTWAGALGPDPQAESAAHPGDEPSPLRKRRRGADR